jgi:hypothetical protein
MKTYVFAAGISNDIGRLSTFQYECTESYTIAKHTKHNPLAVSSSASGKGLTANDVLAAAQAATTKRSERRTLTANYTRPRTADEFYANHTLVCTNGSRHDLMHNLARNLRKIYPVIELQNDKIGNTPASSRPSTTASNPQRSRTPTFVTSGLQVNDQYGRMEAPEEVNTSAYTTSHDGAVIYHDFLSDVCIRGTWFNLRAGTAHLHVLASNAAKMPWNQNKRASIYASSALLTGGSSSGAAPVRGFVDPHAQSQDDHDGADRSPSAGSTQPDDVSLIITGSELHPEWTGWVEGAVLSGALAAKRMHPYLFPPMVARKFMKRVAAPSPEKSSAELGSPIFSGGLDRRATARKKTSL